MTESTPSGPAPSTAAGGPPASVVLERLGGAQRTRVLDDCARLIDQEVASKRGLTALPLKAGYKVIQGVKPGFVRHCVDFLLDDFCLALEPYYQAWSQKDPRPSLESQLRMQSPQVAEALLGVTDRRAQRAQNRTLISLYQKLRGTAKGHVEAALPGLGRTFEPYLK
mgnify:CR=1 FL=1